MKTLRILLLPIPWTFFLIGGVISGVGFCFAAIGGFLHYQTIYRVDMALHRKWLKEWRNN